MGIENIDDLKDESAAPPVDISPSQVQGDPCPTGPTTSPDVVITNDPGPAPEGDAPVDDGSHVVPIEDNDPPSNDEVVNVLGDDADA